MTSHSKTFALPGMIACEDLILILSTPESSSRLIDTSGTPLLSYESSSQVHTVESNGREGLSRLSQEAIWLKALGRTSGQRAYTVTVAFVKLVMFSYTNEMIC